MCGPRSVSEWEERAAGFERAWPALVAEREMSQRVESKFIVPEGALEALLHELREEYVVLTAGTATVATYRSLYFDTDGLDFFHAHRRGRRVRHKVRVRHYPDRQLSTLEIKMRRSDRQTSKVRHPRPYADCTLTSADLELVSTYIPVNGMLSPQVWVEYRRLTLLGVRTLERVTIDVDFHAASHVRPTALQGAAIIEIKQPRMLSHTRAMTALRRLDPLTRGVSKYCAAIAATRPEVHVGRIGYQLRALNRVGTWGN